MGVILQKTHEFVPNLQPTNFRVYEDGVPQKMVGFQRTKAPITAVLLCEFASTNYWFVHDMREAAYAFAQQLQPDDYIAVVTYDLKTQILTDFTQDKRLVYESLNTLTIPGFRETDMFDAVYSTLDRLSRIEGRKYVVLIASGYDSLQQDQPGQGAGEDQGDAQCHHLQRRNRTGSQDHRQRPQRYVRP